MDSLEAYLQGTPLNEELRELRDGVRKPEVSEEVRRRFFGNPENPITRGERVALKELMATDGYPVLARLAEKIALRNESSAISSSKVDPLQNGESIARAWAYTVMTRRALTAFFSEIEAEVKELDKENEQ